jgi:hypothetical protein
MVRFLKGMLEGLGLFQPLQSRVVQNCCKQMHPTWERLETRTLAIEPGRVVVAVFYEEHNVISFPKQYQLYAVSNDCRNVEELPTDPDSPYWIFGRK